MNVDVEIHVLDAGLRGTVPAAFTPRRVAQGGVLDLREIETFPIATGRQGRAALTAELKGKDAFLAARVADDERTKLAVIALIDANDLLLGGPIQNQTNPSSTATARAR